MTLKELTEHYEHLVNQDEHDHRSYKALCTALKNKEIGKSELGPVVGLIVGYAHNAKDVRYRMLEWALRVWIYVMWSHRPGYNDFLMAFWSMCRYETFIVSLILQRTQHKTPAVADTAKWIINSMCSQDAQFAEQVEIIMEEGKA